MFKCDALFDLVTLVQFKKRENTHGGVLLSVKLRADSTPPWLFFTFLNHRNGTKSRNALQINFYLRVFRGINAEAYPDP